ncbi:MAG: HAMP domain-containing histidine kinase [Plectolyngbya sp. WJT66-NPBG17]|jgi:signal transduction histidine kinase|nr:HAMP domain-containing histidine kinase [Plectolyngbya sp. WJT66-NPBG17]MBW4525300.1 HAMP domain-containing histidine kinase [Phormidium tanganyikae FI6-MK23]
MSLNGQSIEIQTCDSGVGMSETVKGKVFEHLFTTKEVGKGTGLGMTIAHQIIVDKHRGSIEANSTPGKGTEFILAIPINAD